MNLCRRCNSEYDKPGTCNCYTESVPGVVIYPGTVVPIFVHPTYPVYPYWYGTVTVETPPNTCGTITNADVGAVTMSGGETGLSGNATFVDARVPFTPTTPLVTSENFGFMLLEAARQCVEYDEQH